MPEFILNMEGATQANYFGLDDFTKGFIEAAFFSDCSCYDSSEFFTPAAQRDVAEGCADGSIPSDAGLVDLDAESLASAVALCAEFQARNAALLSEAYDCDDYDSMQAGRDFYFTRAGHGVGYWDRDQLRKEHPDIPALQAKMRAEGTTPAQWSALLDKMKALQGDLGDRLSDAAGNGEIYLDAYESADSESGFFVSIVC